MKIPWNFNEISSLKRGDIENYARAVKNKYISEEKQNKEFISLISDFSMLSFDRDHQIVIGRGENKALYLDGVSGMSCGNVIVEIDKKLSNEKEHDYKTFSAFFGEEINFVNEYSKNIESYIANPNEAEIIEIPLPCDSYLTYTRAKTMDCKFWKHELLFVYNYFAVYLEEEVDHVVCVILFIEFGL